MADPADRLCKSFAKAGRSLGIKRDEIAAGRGAILSLFAKAKEPLGFALTLSPYYAGHDLRHVERLGELFVDLVRERPPEMNSPLRSPDALVLLFGAFLLHDIGMAFLPADLADVNVEEIWRLHLVRPNHDLRSLEFIERQLLEGWEALSGWNAFWETVGSTPAPLGKWSLLLLARICQSHGDPAEQWLSPTSLDSFEQRDQIVRFPDVWGPGWSLMQRKALACAAVLSLLDLSEIAHDRFPSPPTDEFLQKAIPKGNDERRYTFLHWMGHRIGRTWFENTSIVYEASRSSSEPLRALVTERVGPGGEFFRWAGNPQLWLAMREYVGLNLSGARFSLGPVDDSAWKSVEELAAKDLFEHVSELGGVTEAILRAAGEGSPLDARFILPVWWEVVTHHLWDGCDLHDEQTPFPEGFLVDLRNSGVAWEACVSIRDQFQRRSRALAVVIEGIEPEDEFLLHMYGFICAVAVAQKWMVTKTTLCDLMLARKGGWLHRDLRRGRVDGLDGSLVMVPLHGRSSVGEAGEMIRSLAEDPNGRHTIIFYGSSGEHARYLEHNLGLRIVVCEVVPERTAALRKAARLTASWSGTNVYWELGQALIALYKQRQGAEFLAHGYAALLSEDEGESLRAGLGVIAYLTILELLKLDQTLLSTGKVREEYTSFANVLSGRFELPDVSAVEDWPLGAPLLNDAELLVANQPASALGVMLARTAESSNLGFLLQVAVLLFLETRGWVVNVNSWLFRSVLPVSVRPEILELLFSKTESLPLRCLVGFGLAERLTNPRRRVEQEVRLMMSSVAERCNDLIGIEDFLGFQMVYRVVRGLWASEILDREFVWLQELENPIINLGLFEAIASESASAVVEKPRATDKQMVRALSAFFNNYLDNANGLNNSVPMMAYDIYWKYRTANAVLAEAYAFTSRAESMGWREIAEYLHGGGDESEIHDVTVLHRWRQMRALFLDVLDATPEPLQREEVDDEARERLGVKGD